MRLYYSPNGCSISPHLALEEIGKTFEAERIVISEGGTRTKPFLNINPKGKTPVLVLDDGTVITENPIILQYLAKTYPECKLLPPDTKSEYQALQISEYFSNTVHNFGLTRLLRPQLFCNSEDSWDGVRKDGAEVLLKAFSLIAPRLLQATFLFDEFSVADASVFYFEMQASRLKIAMPPPVQTHFEMILLRPATQRVLAREGLDMATYLPASP